MRDLDYPMDRSGTIYQMKELVNKYKRYPELIAFIAGHYQESSYKTMSPGLKINVRDSAKEWFTKLSETCPAYQGHLAYYWLGRMNHEEGNDSVAAFYFKDYLENESEPPKEYKKIATQLRDEFFVKKELLSNLKKEEMSLTKKIADLDHKNSLLSSNLDLDYVETLIRERFLFGKEGETIYIIKKDEN